MGLVELMGRVRERLRREGSLPAGEPFGEEGAAEQLYGDRGGTTEVQHPVAESDLGRSSQVAGGGEGVQPAQALLKASNEGSPGAREVPTPMGSEAGPRGPSADQRSHAKHLSELGMQARYHRDRHRLYAARMGSSRPFSLSKLSDLKRRREVAESALRHAKDTNQGPSATEGASGK
jgi:hypothetical protein